MRRQQHPHFTTPISVGFGFGRRLCGTTRGLPQAPRCAIHWMWKGAGTPFWLLSAIEGQPPREAAEHRVRRSTGPAGFQKLWVDSKSDKGAFDLSVRQESRSTCSGTFLNSEVGTKKGTGTRDLHSSERLDELEFRIRDGVVGRGRRASRVDCPRVPRTLDPLNQVFVFGTA
jgi:hypothetical protein